MDEQLVKQCTAEAQKWLSPAFDAETQAEVKALLDNEDKTALIDAFYQNLEFGTGGLRGIMGLGTNRMNIHIIRHATQAFAEVIAAEGREAMEKGVCVCFDCRNNSDTFAREAAAIMAANG
ncbi:MAG: phospho-sugar mutase, partial [Bacteroidaceae bacterium]|nr:phospho-sugar mutase [Bacteroidaceae bacterium]